MSRPALLEGEAVSRQLLMVDLWSVILLAFVLAALLYVLKMAPSVPAGVSQPKGIAFFGNLFDMISNWERLQDWMLDNTAKYGFDKTWAVAVPRLGSFHKNGVALFVSTPEGVKHILKDEFSAYEKTDVLSTILHEMLGDGIFTSDGTRWKHHRKVAAAMFSKNLLQQSSSVARDQAVKLRARLQRCAAAAAAAAGKGAKEGGGAEARPSDDIQAAFYAYTMDTFSYIAFGVDLNQNEGAGSPHPFAQAFDGIQQKCQDRFQNPFWGLCRLFQATPDERLITRCRKEMKKFGDTVIGAKRRNVGTWKLAQAEAEAAILNVSAGRRASGAEQDQGASAAAVAAAAAVPDLGPDLISRFLSADDTCTDTELMDVVLNFLIAGRDTTAATLSWTVFELLRNPERMRQVRAELQEKEKAEGKPLDEVDTVRLFEILERELPFTKAVTNETLRLHPSVPKDVKFAVRPDTLPDGTKVDVGMAVFYCPYVMGRNPMLWPQPNEFRPERWLTEEVEDNNATAGTGGKPGLSFFKPTTVSDYKFPTFNAGPRVCLGRPLAYLEIMMALAMILPGMRLTAAKDHQEEYIQTLVPSVKGGVHVHVEMTREL